LNKWWKECDHEYQEYADDTARDPVKDRGEEAAAIRPIQ
jgi:hypothetical protein